MKIFFLTAPFLVLGSAAFAADQIIESEPPVASWTGFYAGVQAGYAFGKDPNGIAFSPLTPALSTAFSPGVNGMGVLIPDAGFSGDFDNAFVGGLHVGYDYQFNNIVVGGILDVSFTNIGDIQRGRSRTPANYDFTRELDVLATGRLRVGYAFGSVLAYGTGGLAYGKIDSRYTDTSAATIQGMSEEENEFGYTIGGGVEAMVTERVSVGFEYLYTNLGKNGVTTNLAGPAPANPFGVIGGPGTDLTGEDGDFDFHTLQLKLSYRF